MINLEGCEQLHCWHQLVHTMNADSVPSGCQPPEQANHLGCESACRLPSSTPTIATLSPILDFFICSLPVDLTCSKYDFTWIHFFKHFQVAHDATNCWTRVVDTNPRSGELSTIRRLTMVCRGLILTTLMPPWVKHSRRMLWFSRRTARLKLCSVNSLAWNSLVHIHSKTFKC